MGERLKEKEIRLLRLRCPTAGGGRKERTTVGTDHLLKFWNFVINSDDGGETVTSDNFNWLKNQIV